MIRSELVNYCLSAHGTLLLAAVFAYYKYGDRTDILQRSKDDTHRFLCGLREIVTLDLKTSIDSLIRESGVTPSLSTQGNSYTEQPTSLADSEKYRQTIRRFVESDIGAIADYKIAIDAYRSWCGWFKRISWSILMLIYWELLGVVSLGVLDKAFDLELPEIVIQITLLPSASMVALIITCVTKMLVRHDKITEKKEEYPAISS